MILLVFGQKGPRAIRLTAQIPRYGDTILGQEKSYGQET